MRKPEEVHTMTVREEKLDLSKPRPADELLTVREVARQLRVDDTTVRRWIKTGALEAVTLPHRGKRRGYRVRKITLDQLLSGSTLSS
jgi:excisionase family DNA binding protein